MYINIHKHNIEHQNCLEIINILEKDAQKIIFEHPSLYFSVGIHPCSINQNISQRINLIEQLSQHKQVLAIGEIGLDKRSKTDINTQKEIFITQVQIAEKAQKPIIIHCVKAYQEILEIKTKLKPNIPFIFHGFRGNQQLAKQILNQNCYISVGEKFNPETIQIIPVNKLFIETDESLKKIEDIYQHIAHIRETNSDELLEKITKNFKIIFKI